MRYLLPLAPLAVLTSCTVLRPEGTWVRGSIWLVPQAEVRSAIAVARAGAGDQVDPIDAVIVSSHCELYVYFHSSIVIDGTYGDPCFVVRKENGRWHYGGFAASYVPYP